MIGTVMVPPVEAVSKSGNIKHTLKVLVDPADGSPGTWWNLTIMDSLFREITANGAESVLAKFGYAKFIGLGKRSTFVGRDGATRSNCDMLVNAIELQNGTYISTKKNDEDRRPSDEDAPF